MIGAEIHMMTIDEMLSKVSELVKASEPVAEKEVVRHEAVIQRPRESIKPEIPVVVKEPAAVVKKQSAELITKQSLTLKLAKEITYCVEKVAERIGVSVVTAVMDGSGRLILLEAMDDSFIASISAAQDKAYTAAALKMPTHTALKESRGGSLDGYTNGGGILMLGGGYPIFHKGNLIGSIGVSGGTKEQDMLLAETGIKYFEERIKIL